MGGLSITICESFFFEFVLFIQNCNVKVRVCISLICWNSDIFTNSTFSYIRSLRRHISVLSFYIYTFRRIGLSVVSVAFPLKIGKCSKWQNLEKNIPNFKTVSLNTKFLYELYIPLIHWHWISLSWSLNV